MTEITKVQFEELKRNLQEDRNPGRCPVWPEYSTGSPQISPLHDRHFWSPRAGGVFKVPSGVPNLHAHITDEETRKRISSWIWKKNVAFEMLRNDEEKSEEPQLTVDLIRQLGEEPAMKTEQRIDRALQATGRSMEGISASTSHLDDHLDDRQALFMAATECGSWEEMVWLFSELKDAGLVVDTTRCGNPRHLLTLKGINRLETGGAALVSNTAFVAMWFNPEVHDAYGTGIEPAIRDAGYEPVRIDRQEHADRIDDRIIAEIRRARFLVCDFTCGLLQVGEAESGSTAVARGGVYYEAGFAHGLGKRVIWTCRSDLIAHVHFDLRQYNCICWKKGKEDKLREALHNRIRAVIT